MSANCMTIMIDQCLRLDTHATRIYRQLSEQAGNPDLKSFWQTIARQNEQYLGYWEKLFDWAAKGLLDNLFAAPQQTLDELTVLQEKVRCLADFCSAAHKKEKAFTMAFKLEFYLLHPAIETLGQYMATFNGATTGEVAYERFVGRLFDALQQHDLGTLELELVGEAIHRLWRENRRMAFLSNYDELTGIFNRRGLFNAIHHLAHLSQRNDNTVGVLMIDIDHFKAINDSHGHPAGDAIIQYTVGTARSQVRESDSIFRWGGDEFLLLLPDCDLQHAARNAERIRQKIAEMPVYFGSVTIPVTVSIGVAQLAKRESQDSLVERVDRALYLAKQEGRDRVHVAV